MSVLQIAEDNALHIAHRLHDGIVAVRAYLHAGTDPVDTALAVVEKILDVLTHGSDVDVARALAGLPTAIAKNDAAADALVDAKFPAAAAVLSQGGK